MVWVSVYFTTDLIQTGVDLRRTIFRMKVSFDFFFLSSLAPSLKPQNVEVLESLTTTLCSAIGHGMKY